jgi:hypothetical protein
MCVDLNEALQTLQCGGTVQIQSANLRYLHVWDSLAMELARLLLMNVFVLFVRLVCCSISAVLSTQAVQHATWSSEIVPMFALSRCCATELITRPAIE